MLNFDTQVFAELPALEVVVVPSGSSVGELAALFPVEVPALEAGEAREGEARSDSTAS